MYVAAGGGCRRGVHLISEKCKNGWLFQGIFYTVNTMYFYINVDSALSVHIKRIHI